MNDPEIQGATIGKTQRELESEAVKPGDVKSVMSSDASLHFKVGRHRLTRIGKMLVDVEVIVHASDRPLCLEHVAIAHWLLDQSLHDSVPRPIERSSYPASAWAPASGCRDHEPEIFPTRREISRGTSSIWQVDARKLIGTRHAFQDVDLQRLATWRE
jgi:hypothetical protein